MGLKTCVDSCFSERAMRPSLSLAPPARKVSYERGTPVGQQLQFGGVRPLHQKSTCLTQLTSGPGVVHIWSRNTLGLKGDETLVQGYLARRKQHPPRTLR